MFADELAHRVLGVGAMAIVNQFSVYKSIF